MTVNESGGSRNGRLFIGRGRRRPPNLNDGAIVEPNDTDLSRGIPATCDDGACVET